MRRRRRFSVRERAARDTLAVLASALIFGPSAAQAGTQLFEASWTVKAFGNERTGGAGESAIYWAFGLPQGIQCNPNQPRCQFDSTPTDGMSEFSPLGGSQIIALYCHPWANWQGYGATARPAKGGTAKSIGGALRPPLYRNSGFFTPTGQPRTTSCTAASTGATPGGKGLVQAGQPITGTWTATTTGTAKGGFNFAAAPATGSAGVRATGVIGEFSASYPYVYSYTYATLRNDLGVFGPGGGPGSFNLPYTVASNTVASINVKQGAAKFGGTMRMLGDLTAKVCYYFAGGCSRGEQNWRYDVVGASASTSMSVVTKGYITTHIAHFYHSGMKATSTITAEGSRFPWTTGSVTVTATGRGPGNTVHYAQGFDNRTSLTGLGTIQLVSPLITRWFGTKDIETGGIGILRIKFVSPPSGPTNEAILQPAGVSTDMGTSAGAISNVIDQSGLSAGYTSQVANFDNYIASTPSHDSLMAANIWMSSSPTTTGNVDFDLGGTFFLQSFALWNRGAASSDNITGITLLADDNASFSSPVSLGSFTPNPNTGPIGSVLAEVFSLTVASASHVRMQITSNNGASTTGFGEVAFELAGDLDSDGIPDAFETNTGTYVSSTDTGTDPNDADSDDDGLDDGAEVALGTDPNEEDSDGDLVCDGDMQVGVCTAAGPDNCPLVSNFSQTNSDALAAGDDCQCGNVDDIGGVTLADVTRVRENLLGIPLGGPFDATRCNVIGPSDGGVSDCDIADIFVLQRFLAGSPVTVADACDAYSPP